MLSPSRPAYDSAVSHRVLSLLLFFPLFFSPHLSILCMGRERSSGCCVILLSRFIGATHNFCPPPSVLYRTAAPTKRHLYLIVSYTPVSGPHLVSPFSYHHYPVAVCSASLALAPIVCAYYFLPLTPFVVYIFYPTFPFSSVYIPP